jgi:hypothetical protein
MMGSTKVSTIRAEIRKGLNKSDAELLAWFNRQIAKLQGKPKTPGSQAESLRLLRDALVKETKSQKSRRNRSRATGRSKN